MRTQCNWPFVIVLAGFALLGAYLGYGLAHHPKLVWFKPLNILGLAYGLLVHCATLLCTYAAAAASAAFARVTLARMSVARAVQMNGFGSML